MSAKTVQLAVPESKELDAMETVQIANQVFPAAFDALQQAETVEEINLIRDKVFGLGEYLKRRLPSELKDRATRLAVANQANRIYLLACRMAGAAWDLMDKYRGRPPEKDDGQMELDGLDKSVQFGTLMTAEEAGFFSRQEAQKCAKVSRIDYEDWELYFEEADREGRQYTLGGLVHVYDLLNPKQKENQDQGEEVRFSKSSIAERMNGLLTKAENLREDMKKEPGKWGDAFILLEQAIEALNDAVEVLEK